MKNLPDKPGLWHREGKNYRVWEHVGTGKLACAYINEDGHELGTQFVHAIDSGNWQPLAPPVTLSEAKKELHEWISQNMLGSGYSPLVDKAAELFGRVEQEPAATRESAVARIQQYLFSQLFGDFFDFDAIDRHHEKRRQEFMKLATDPPAKSAEVGDRVLVAGGPIGRGFEWERLEAVVLEVADTAYHVRFTKRKTIHGEPDEEWVHRFTVTDVLGPALLHPAACNDLSHAANLALSQNPPDDGDAADEAFFASVLKRVEAMGCVIYTGKTSADHLQFAVAPSTPDGNWLLSLKFTWMVGENRQTTFVPLMENPTRGQVRRLLEVLK